MLGAKLSLHDIPDVEDFCSQIVHLSRLELTYHEREDLITELIEICWELSERYDPEQVRSFGIWSRHILGLRTVDWIRKHRGRTRWQFANGDYNRDRVQLLSLGDPLAESYAKRSVDSTEDRLSDLHRLLGSGDSDPPSGERGMGEGKDDVAA